MPAGSARSAVDLRGALRRYLTEHPEAADSLTGIRQWWVPEALQQIAAERIRGALEEMIASGEVRSERLPDGTELFSRARQAHDTHNQRSGNT